MNAYLWIAVCLFFMFMGMGIIGIMYSTPMPLIAFLVLVALVIFVVVGLVESSKNGDL